ncbi:myotubularin-related protein 2 [Stylonychia lemnae]|uniref:Myotubularin-related protein 2 n=1 Tax=Stylonychia lemnae TaxID=5949 RepID=A0A078AV99_STYLE|nr:myotubularin-related protein 2 [Stylonychia lemnae]|eukprot:CDW86315.1 myotubularin-related protein 2 [Stylonychia lemnae]
MESTRQTVVEAQKNLQKLESTKIQLGDDPFSLLQQQKEQEQTQQLEKQLVQLQLQQKQDLQYQQDGSSKSTSPFDQQNEKQSTFYDANNGLGQQQEDLPNQKHFQDFGYELQQTNNGDNADDDQPFENEQNEAGEEQKIEEEAEKIEPLVERVRKSLNQKSQKKKIQGLIDDEIECGEEQVMKIKVKCDCNVSINCPTLEGDLIMTNFKLIFKHQTIAQVQSVQNEKINKSNLKIPTFIETYLNIALTCINKIDKTIIDKKTSKINFLEIFTKDFRYIKLIFENMDQCNDAMQRIQIFAFPESDLRDIFAFKFFDPSLDLQRECLENGWDIYQSPDLEFKRQEITIQVVYKSRSLIESFLSSHACNPSFFQGQYTICECKIQDKVQISKSPEDELLLLEIGRTNPDATKKLQIFDARSYINALANRVNKGGFENVKDNYVNCDISFCDIDNIHGVRDAINKVYEMSLQPWIFSNSSKWLTQLDNSGWLQIMSKILISTNKVVEKIMIDKQNVLVHCSDGWDRTAQLCSLSQILLDPFFRTLKGFQILIEKDWLSFGHMFQRRYGHFNKNYKDEQRCPVFTQFLDAVYQLMHQFPTHFQFNKKLLLFIITELYTCKYGTFLFNTQRERHKFKLREKTLSMWTHVNHYSEQFLNPFYDSERQEQIPKIPVTNYYELKVWKELFFRYTEQTPYFKHPEISSPDDHKDQLMKRQLKINQILKNLVQGSQDLLKRMDKRSELTADSIRDSIGNDSNFSMLDDILMSEQQERNGMSAVSLKNFQEELNPQSDEILPETQANNDLLFEQ